MQSNLSIEQIQDLLLFVVVFMAICLVLLVVAESIKDWKTRPAIEKRKYPKHRRIK